MNEHYLQHFGIKGMRWGVRRFQNEDGTLTPSGEKRYSLYHFGVKGMKWGVRKKRNYHPDSSRAWARKKAYELSDSELNRRINRINKEQEYRNKTENSALRAGRKFFSKAIGSVVVAVVAAQVAKTSRDALNDGMKAVENILDPIREANFDDLLGFKK